MVLCHDPMLSRDDLGETIQVDANARNSVVVSGAVLDCTNSGHGEVILGAGDFTFVERHLLPFCLQHGDAVVSEHLFAPCHPRWESLGGLVNLFALGLGQRQPQIMLARFLRPTRFLRVNAYQHIMQQRIAIDELRLDQTVPGLRV